MPKLGRLYGAYYTKDLEANNSRYTEHHCWIVYNRDLIGIIAVGYADIMQFAPLATTILTVILVFLIIVVAIFPIVGGIFALQRRKWGWSLAGSIIAIFEAFPLGVASTIFVAIAKSEFE